jgi:hypothetical protein
MCLHDQSAERRGGVIGFLTSPSGLVFVGFLVIAGIYLWSEHQAHLFGTLIWLPLLVCPLMHLFHGHGGHGGHAGHRQLPDNGAGK